MDATVRFAAELGYEVTVARDAIASYSDDHMHAALDVNHPNYASAIVTAIQVVDSLSSRPRRKRAATERLPIVMEEGVVALGSHAHWGWAAESRPLV